MPVIEEVTEDEAPEGEEPAGEKVTMYMPEHVAGKRTIFPTEDEGVFRIDNSELESAAPALGYRKSMRDDDRAGDGLGAKWGTRATGVMEDGGSGEQDRWLRVEVDAASLSKAPAVIKKTPPPPAMPSMKMSQIAPLVVMMGLSKVDIEELGYVRHVEVAFVIVQLLCIGVQVWIHQKISAKPDTGKKLKIPEVKQMGQVVTQATVQSPKQYDTIKWQEGMKQAVMSSVITGGIYYKWAYLMPLVLQVLMTPLQLYESPLFQAHALGKHVDRPFPASNPFGMPGTPEPPAEEVEDEAVEDKKAK